MPMPDPFSSIAATDLHEVTGGRKLTRKGPDPVVSQMMLQLTESIKLVSASQEKQQAESAQMTQQLMQKMMAGRG